MTFWYSPFVNPSPPYSFGIFMPKAPMWRRVSITASGYSPVASISTESTSSRRNRFISS